MNPHQPIACVSGMNSGEISIGVNHEDEPPAAQGIDRGGVACLLASRGS